MECKFCDKNSNDQGYRVFENEIIWDDDVCDVCKGEILAGLRDDQDVIDTNNSLMGVI